jgi:hypothetical protein
MTGQKTAVSLLAPSLPPLQKTLAFRGEFSYMLEEIPSADNPQAKLP